MTIDIQAIIKDIIAQSEVLAEQLLADFSKQGLLDVKDFLQNSKDDLQRWTGELAQGEISQDDFNDLIQGQIDVALLHGLKQTGLGEVDLDKFTLGIQKIITAVVFDAIKGAAWT